MFSGSFGIDLGWKDSYNDYDSEKMNKLRDVSHISKKRFISYYVCEWFKTPQLNRLYLLKETAANGNVFNSKQIWFCSPI